MGEPSSPNDISWATGLDKTEVQQLLQQLEADEVVTKVPPLSESMADVRFYILTDRTKSLLRQILAAQLEVIIGRPRAIELPA